VRGLDALFADALGTDATAIAGAIADGRAKGLRPLRALLAAGVPLGSLQAAAWTLQGHVMVEVHPAELELATMSTLPLAVCRRSHAVVVRREGPTAVVAVADPSDVGATDELRRALGPAVRIDIRVADAESIDEALRRYEAIEIMGPGEETPDVAADAPVALGGDSQAARNVAAIVTYAVHARASDIHVSCDDTGAEVRIRIDGVLHPYTRFAGTGAAAALLGRIKVLGGLDLGQRRLPQDGRIHVEVDGRVVDIRLVTMPNVWAGEDAVLRILDTSAGHVAIDSLGLSPTALAAWKRLWQVPHGLLLVAGPTGAGKSTTLYATLRQIATPDRSVRTVEDPVEVRLPGVTQVQVNPRAGLTFASALRSFLRADPDVILVGEIRDHETARVATEAAMTGHLVLATVHTSSAPQVPARLVEMGVPTYLVSAALRGAMAQRLVRRLCHHCRLIRSAPVGGPWYQSPPTEVHDAAPGGCGRCAHTGYRGRLAVAEVMVVGEDIQQAISEGVGIARMTELAVRSGMVPLDEAIAIVIRDGESSLTELARVATTHD
jgi:type IV pilus assembly protein PilB